MTLFHAQYISDNFNFELIETTKERAIERLQIALEEHTKQFKCEPNWWKYGDNYDLGEHVRSFTLGVAYRDGLGNGLIA